MIAVQPVLMWTQQTHEQAAITFVVSIEMYISAHIIDKLGTCRVVHNLKTSISVMPGSYFSVKSDQHNRM